MNTPNGRRHSTARTAARRSDAWRQPVLLWALVLMVAMMSFYVHLLNTQVQRGEGLRQAQRHGSQATAVAAADTAARAPRAIRVSQNTAAR